MLTALAIIVVAALAGLFAYAAMRPDTFEVRRSTTIDAPPASIYALIEDFHRWPAWSPYEKLDPALKRSLSGTDHGVGAVYAWEGNSKAGAGRMQIVEARAPEQVVIELDFARPFVAHHTAEFTVQRAGGATQVTWAMRGPSRYMAKLMGVFVNMDRMIGKDFESGLANLKAIVEGEAR